MAPCAVAGRGDAGRRLAEVLLARVASANVGAASNAGATAYTTATANIGATTNTSAPANTLATPNTPATANTLPQPLPGDPDHGVFGALRGVVSDDLIVILGPADALPWADGCVYLGRTPDAAGVYYPTLLRPDVPVALHARATTARGTTEDLPLAWVDPHTLVPLGAARPIEAARLAAWLRGDGPGSRRPPGDGRGDPLRDGAPR